MCAQAPEFSIVPAARQVVVLNRALTLEVVAEEATSYQWKRNGRVIAGATDASYTIGAAKPVRDNGWYQVIATNAGGSATSPVIFVTVTIPSAHVFGIGYGENGQLKIPAGLGSVAGVFGGGSYAVALKSDGSVAAWGYNGHRQTEVPAGLGGVVEVATPDLPVALITNGTLVSWGSNGAFGVKVPAGLDNVVAVAAGDSHTVALKSDGKAVVWGSSNNYGQLTIPDGLDGVVAVAPGGFHTIALKADGTVVTWGDNTYGQLAVPAGLTGVTAVAAGGGHSVALKSDGTVVVWGDNHYGQRAVPFGLSGVVAIGAGQVHSIALRSDGTVVAWGHNGYGQTTIPANLGRVEGLSVDRYTNMLLRDASADVAPAILKQPKSEARNLGGGVTFSVDAALGSAPASYQWRKGGANIFGATAASYAIAEITAASAGDYDVVVSNHVGSVTSAVAALTVTASPIVNAVNYGRYPIAEGQSLVFALDAAIAGSATVQWKRNGFSIPGATGRTLTIANADRGSSGYYQAVYLESAGFVTSAPIFVAVAPSATRLFGWGSDVYGQLSFPSDLTTAVAVSGNVAAGALKSDGTVVLSNGSIPPGYLGRVAAFSVGLLHYLALKADGTVVQWGDVSRGQGSPPADLAGVVAVSAGTRHSLALKTDGRVVSWGNGDSGATSVPSGLAGVVAVSAGLDYSLALQSGGTVVGWGANGFGQRTVPSGLAGVVAVAAGGTHSLALKSDGTVVAWGANSFGQANVPVGLTDVIAIAAGGDHSVALKADGHVVAWGANNHGQVSVPPGLNAIMAIAAGREHTIALRDITGDVAPTVTSQPGSLTSFAGQEVTLTVGATGGTAIPSYQWRKSGIPVVGATTSTLTLRAIVPADAGQYDVVITNQLGSTTSAVATLVVVDPERSLFAGTARATVGPGSHVVTGVFTVEGAGPKQMLVRGAGPVLGWFGDTGFLVDPRLTIVNATTGAVVASNDDWGSAANAAQVAAASAQVGALAFPSGSKDAAVLAMFAPGTYRATLSGAGSGTGTGLLEIFDADSTPRLVYLATLAKAGAGAETLVKGLTIAAPVAGRGYLVRALGPALGSAGALADPRLSVFAGEALVAENDDWAGDAAITVLAASVGATSLPAASKDAAVAVAPALPGAFTVQVRGAGAGTGHVLVEVFEVDATRAATIAPVVVAGPEPVFARAGQSATLGIVALGKPPPVFQWRKDSVAIPGATDRVLAFSPALPGNSGVYDVVVTNSAGSATSPIADVEVNSPHTHALTGGSSAAGGTATISNTLTYLGSPTGLAWSVTLPSGWTLVSDSATAAATRPAAGAGGTLTWDWSVPPPTPVTFTFTVTVPVTENSERSIRAVATVRSAVGAATLPAGPDPLRLPQLVFHSADSDRNRHLNLGELLRVIALFNYRVSGVRTGQYSRWDASEDGFTVGAGGAPLAGFHSADFRGGTSPTGPDGRIDLVELTRVIELYNYRAGSVRTGQYRAKGGTEDGFAPGPEP